MWGDVGRCGEIWGDVEEVARTLPALHKVGLLREQAGR